jgi:hypothetical protein
MLKSNVRIFFCDLGGLVGEVEARWVAALASSAASAAATQP